MCNDLNLIPRLIRKGLLTGSSITTAAMILLVLPTAAQVTSEKPALPGPDQKQELKVNWIYGAYVAKDVSLRPLSNRERFDLFLRQSFTTPGVYVKTAFFSLSDQASNSPPEWGDGIGGYAKRTASRYGQFVSQNALSGVGNAILGLEPRYDRCKCTKFWPRTGHALLRNFVTYDRSENHLWPQLGLYSGAFGAGVIAGTWMPGKPDLLAKGYQSVTTQIIFGMCANWLGEFAPDFKRVLKRHHAKQDAALHGSGFGERE